MLLQEISVPPMVILFWTFPCPSPFAHPEISVQAHTFPLEILGFEIPAPLQLSEISYDLFKWTEWSTIEGVFKEVISMFVYLKLCSNY